MDTNTAQPDWAEDNIVMRLSPLAMKRKKNSGIRATNIMIGVRWTGRTEKNQKLLAKIRRPRPVNNPSPHNVVGLCGMIGASTTSHQHVTALKNAAAKQTYPKRLGRLLQQIRHEPEGQRLEGLLGTLKQWEPKLYREMTGR